MKMYKEGLRGFFHVCFPHRFYKARYTNTKKLAGLLQYEDDCESFLLSSVSFVASSESAELFNFALQNHMCFLVLTLLVASLTAERFT